MALVRYGMSHRRKKQKDQELEEDARVMSSAGERLPATEEQHSVSASIYAGAVADRPYSTVPPVNLDLPMAHTLDDRPSTYLY